MKVIMESPGSYILSTETSKKFLSYTVHVSQVLKNKSKVNLNLAFRLIQLDEIMIFRKDESKKDYKQHLLQIIILL